MMTTKPRKWFGQRFVPRPLQPRPEVAQREVFHTRMLKKAPYKVSYGEFTYAIQPVVLEDEKISYIAARMVTEAGRLMQPLHEYELSKRFPSLTGAQEAWSEGFVAKTDQFISRALVARLVDEQIAEVIPAPPKVLPPIEAVL